MTGSLNLETNILTHLQTDAAVDGYITLEARDGDASEVDLSIKDGSC